MKKLFHFSRQGEFLGKHGEEDVIKLIKSGLLKPTDDYWTKGMRAWAKVSLLSSKNITSAPVNKSPTISPAKYYLNPKILTVSIILVLTIITSIVVLLYLDGKKIKAGEENVLPSSSRYQGQLLSSEGFSPFSPYGQEIFPSKIISYSMTGFKPKVDTQTVSHFGSDDYISGVIVDQLQVGDTVEVEISGDRFIKSSKIKITINESVDYATFGPAPCYDFESLSHLTQTTPFNVTIRAKKNDGPVKIFNEVWQAHQINDCPINLSRRVLKNNRTIYQENLNTRNCIAGYVNENHPMIDLILAKAKAEGANKEFYGYAQGDEKIIEQIELVWNALQKSGVTYSNISESTISPLHSFQHIRLLEQTFSERQSNCLDGSVMLASILRKIGLNVSIILVPKHAFLVVYDSKHKNRLLAIETTMIGKCSLSSAITFASKESEVNLRLIETLLNDAEHPEYYEVDIQSCREIGIQPIPYSK